MPRPHYPIRGGSRIAQGSAAGHQSDAGAECEGCRDRSAEIDRLRQELLRARAGGSEAAPRLGGAGVMWAALAICGMGLIFALAAIFRHG